MRGIQRPKTQVRAVARDVLSRALVLLTLIAFAFQGYLTQTHIHIRSAETAAVTDVLDGGFVTNKAPAKDLPVKGDESNCPLCQAFAGAGHFVTPASAAALLPSFTVSVIALVIRAIDATPAVSHIWLGRAPPLG
jgi:hypothetical protein